MAHRPRTSYKAREDQTFTNPNAPFGAKHYKSLIGKLRKELLEREIFDTLLEAKDLIERWRQVYNTVRPHGSLGYRSPALEATQPWSAIFATLQL
jgi:putative transposase